MSKQNIFCMVLCLFGLVSCQRQGSYLETFYDVDLIKVKTGQQITFHAKAQANKRYHVMLIFYPENERLYSEMGDLNGDYSDETNKKMISFETTVSNNQHGEYYKNSSVSRIHESVPYDGERPYQKRMRLILTRPLHADRDYKISVTMNNLDNYPFKHIKAKLAFGVGETLK